MIPHPNLQPSLIVGPLKWWSGLVRGRFGVVEVTDNRSAGMKNRQLIRSKIQVAMHFSRLAVNTRVPLDDLGCGIVLRSIKDLGKRREKARKRNPLLLLVLLENLLATCAIGCIPGSDPGQNGTCRSHLRPALNLFLLPALSKGNSHTALSRQDSIHDRFYLFPMNGFTIIDLFPIHSLYFPSRAEREFTESSL